MFSTINTRKDFPQAFLLLMLMAPHTVRAEFDSRNYTPIVGVIGLCAMFGLVTVCICCKGLFTSTDRDGQAGESAESLLPNSTASGS